MTWPRVLILFGRFFSQALLRYNQLYTRSHVQSQRIKKKIVPEGYNNINDNKINPQKFVFDRYRFERDECWECVFVQFKVSIYV